MISPAQILQTLQDILRVKDIERSINGEIPENISAQWAQKGEPLGIEARAEGIFQSLPVLAVAFPGRFTFYFIS